MCGEWGRSSGCYWLGSGQPHLPQDLEVQRDLIMQFVFRPKAGTWSLPFWGCLSLCEAWREETELCLAELPHRRHLEMGFLLHFKEVQN